MYCKNCEVKLEDGVSVCPTCGTKVKLKKYLKTTTLIIFLIIAVVVLVVFLMKNLNNKKMKEQLEKQAVEITVIPKNNYKTLAGFTFKLPMDLQYSNEDNYIYAATKDLKIYFKMNVILLNYDSVIENQKKFVDAIIKSGINVISYKTLTFDEKEYFVLAINQINKQYVYAITRLESNYAVQTIIETVNDDGYDLAINTINKIINKYEKINTKLANYNIGSLNDFLISDSDSINNISDLFKEKEENK